MPEGANSSATLSLNIDAKQLLKADEALEHFASTSEKTEKRVNSASAKIIAQMERQARQIEQLKREQKRMNELMQMRDAARAAQNMSPFVGSVKKATDMLIQLGLASQSSSGEIKLVSDTINTSTQALDKNTEAILKNIDEHERTARVVDSVGRSATSSIDQTTSAVVKQGEAVKALRRSWDEAEKAKDAAAMARAQTAYDAMFPQGTAEERGREAAKKMMEGFQRQFDMDIARIKDGQARGFLSPEEARLAGQQAAIEYNKGLLSSIDQGYRQGAFKGEEGDAAFIRMANSFKNIEETSKRASLGMGQLRGGMTALMRQALSLNPSVASLSGILGSFALGAAPTIAIMAGIAAVGWAWKKMAGEADESAKKVEEAIERLRQAADKTNHSLTAVLKESSQLSKLSLDVLAARAKLEELIEKREDNKIDMELESRIAVATVKEYNLMEKYKKQLKDVEGIVGAFNEQERLKTVQLKQSEADQLAVLISSGHATEAHRQKALQLAKKYRDDIRKYSGQDDLSITQRVEAVRGLQAINSAFEARVKATSKVSDADKAALKSLQNYIKELEAYEEAQVILRTNAANDLMQMRIQIKGQERMTAAIKQGQDAVDQLNIQLAGEAAYRNLAAEATEYQRNEMKRLAEGYARGIITQRKAIEQIDKIKKAEKERAKSLADRVKEMKDSMQHTMRDFFADIFSNGIKSFGDLFTRVKDMFFRLVADMMAARMVQRFGGIALTAAGLGSAKAANAQDKIMGISSSLFSKEMLNKMNPQSGWMSAMKYGGVGLAGLGIGYGLGSSTTNVAGGGLLGAGGGAATGAMMGSVIPGIGTAVGAAVGGITGFIGGLFGAGSAAKKAAKEMKSLQESLSYSLAAVRAQVNGSGDSLTYSLIQAQAEFKKLRDETKKAYATRKHEAERVKILQELEVLEAKRLLQLREEYDLKIQHTREDLQVRLLRAKGMDKEAEEMEFILRQQREYDEMRKAGMDEQTLLMLKEVQLAEKAAFAAKEIEKLTASLSNAPSGFKVAHDRYLATVASIPGEDVIGRPFPDPRDIPSPNPPKLLPTQAAGKERQALETAVIQLHGDVHITSTATNAEELFQELQRKLQLEASRGGTTRFILNTRVS